MSESFAAVQRQVEARAGSRCEYCRMHQALQGATFHVEHIQPRSRGGNSQPDNLAWCCPSCNLRKADRVEAVDPETGVIVPLFHPRRQVWAEEFAWNGDCLVGRSAGARATVAALGLNDARRLLIRQAERNFQLFPPYA